MQQGAIKHSIKLSTLALWTDANILYLLYEWEGQTGKYMAQGHAAWNERPRAKYFPIRPHQFSRHMTQFFVTKREERNAACKTNIYSAWKHKIFGWSG